MMGLWIRYNIGLNTPDASDVHNKISRQLSRLEYVSYDDFGLEYVGDSKGTRSIIAEYSRFDIHKPWLYYLRCTNRKYKKAKRVLLSLGFRELKDMY